jgi:aspartate/methionine/tyrosine aminotransferase
MHEFIRLSQQDDMASIHEVVRVNRKALHDNLAGTFLSFCERPFASVAWLRINHSLNSSRLKQVLDEHGVFVLPGNHFFWHEPRQGEKFIRVALARDTHMFREAAALLAEVCRAVGDRVEVGV